MELDRDLDFNYRLFLEDLSPLPAAIVATLKNLDFLRERDPDKNIPKGLLPREMLYVFGHYIPPEKRRADYLWLDDIRFSLDRKSPDTPLFTLKAIKSQALGNQLARLVRMSILTKDRSTHRYSVSQEAFVNTGFRLERIKNDIQRATQYRTWTNGAVTVIEKGRIKKDVAMAKEAEKRLSPVIQGLIGDFVQNPYQGPTVNFLGKKRRTFSNGLMPLIIIDLNSFFFIDPEFARLVMQERRKIDKSSQMD